MTVVYDHKAVPPVGIVLNKAYEVIETDDCYLVNNVEIEKDLLLVLFKEVNVGNIKSNETNNTTSKTSGVDKTTETVNK